MMDRDRGKERIFIGDNIERWNRVKDELNLMFNHEVAGFLLDRSVFFFFTLENSTLEMVIMEIMNEQLRIFVICNES